jgi:predicted TPR repeat methyltransferase
MLVVFHHRGFRFFFYSNEGLPREPAHIHVEKGNMEAKFWLEPEVRLAYNDGYVARSLRELLEIVELNRDRIERAWNEFFG